MTVPARYPRPLILLHWLLAVLILGLLGSGLAFASGLLPPLLHFQLIQWHKAFGVAVLLLVVVRVLVRGYAHRRQHIPPLPRSLPRWELRAAHLGHVGLYALMLLVPISGWVMVSASPFILPTTLFAEVVWPHIPLTADVKTLLYPLAHQAHELLAYGLAALVALHVAAVFKHARRDHLNLLPRIGLGRPAPHSAPLSAPPPSPHHKP